jgi:hypothetical protein
MIRSLLSLRSALLLGASVMAGCASILGDYELTGGSGASGGAGDASASANSTTSSGGGDPVDGGMCGAKSTISMQDDFNDNVTSANWSINSGAGHITAAETKGRLQVTTDGTGISKGGYQWMAPARSLVGCHLSVEVNTGTSGFISTIFNLVTEADPAGAMNLMGITQSGGKIQALIRSNGSDTLHVELPFSSISMHWWRMREYGGNVIFEVSPDAKAWAELAHGAAPPFIAAIRPQLFVGPGKLAMSNGGTATFDNLNKE